MGEGKQLIGPLKPCQEPRARGSGRGDGQVGQLKRKSGSLQHSMERGYRICCSRRWGQSGTVCGFERSWAGWRMPVSLCSLSSEWGWQILGFRSEAWLGWLLEKFPLSSQTLKMCSSHGWPPITAQTRVLEAVRQQISAGTCWLPGGVLSLSCSLEADNWAEYNIFAYFPEHSPRACISQTSRVNPQDNLALKEKMWGAYLKIWIPEASVCPASAGAPDNQLKEMDTHRESSKFLLLLLLFVTCKAWLLSIIKVPENMGSSFLFFPPISFLSFFPPLSFSAKINHTPLSSWEWFIKAIKLESASSSSLISQVKDIWGWSVYSQHCNIGNCICIC